MRYAIKINAMSGMTIDTFLKNLPPLRKGQPAPSINILPGPYGYFSAMIIYTVPMTNRYHQVQRNLEFAEQEKIARVQRDREGKEARYKAEDAMENTIVKKFVQ